MPTPKDYLNTVVIFIYQDSVIKTLTNCLIPDTYKDIAVINGFMYNVRYQITDIDENKIYVYLDDEVNNDE